MKSSVTWKIGGEAGFGIMASGTMFAKSYSRAGYHIFAMNEYPSLIRGGHNLVTVRIATEKFTSLNRDIHILVALNKETIEKHKAELTAGAVVVFDPSDADMNETDFPHPVHLVRLPLLKIVQDLKGERIMRNTVAIGASLALLGSDFSLIESVIHDQFGKKGEEVIGMNIAIAKAGYIYIQEQYPQLVDMHIEKTTAPGDALVINASEAVGVGAVRAGLKFAAIYPMTPINSLISFLADHAKEFQIVYKQPEDEIAGINMAIGASYAGVRSMVATSGGGFALMIEGLSLAGMIEVPLVIDLGMRPGPATGMPTWTAQGELQLVIHAGHGDFPRIVLAPADAEDAYHLTIEAFHLADKYQAPVFVLTDKYINESQWCVPAASLTGEVVVDRGKVASATELQSGFARYRTDTDDGVSPRSFPGMKGGFYYANGYEHNGVGHMTEDATERDAMVTKRLKKLTAMQKAAVAPVVFGDTDATLTFVSWGSPRGAILEAMKLLTAQGIHSRLIQFRWLFPFPVDAFSQLIRPTDRIVDVEQNATGQLAALIQEHTGVRISEKLLKNDGRPYYPEEIVEFVS